MLWFKPEALPLNYLDASPKTNGRAIARKVFLIELEGAV